MTWRTLIVLMVIVLACPPARAGTEIQRTGLQSHLITDVRIQRELRLTEAQRDAVWDLSGRTSGLVGDIIRERIRKKEAPDRRKDAAAVARIMAEHSTALARILDRGQFARYEQIRLQYLREEALLDPAVQKAIKLDAGRAEQLTSIFLGYLEEYDRAGAEFQKRPMKEKRRLATKTLLENMARRDAALKRMRELLTDEQRAAFEALKGPIFRIEGREELGSAFEQAVPRGKPRGGQKGT